MTNKQIARVLKETAALIELTGGNAFRARAFHNAARTIDRLEEPAVGRLEAGSLTSVPGIGKGLADQIAALVDTGTFEVRDELMAAVPPGLRDVLRIKGLGAKKVRALWQELDVTSLDDLQHAAQTGRIADLSGFGRRTQETILEQIDVLRTYLSRRRYAEVVPAATALLERLRAHEALRRVEPTGDYRRRMETLERVDLLAAADEPGVALESLTTAFDVATAPSAELPTLEGTLPDGFPFRLVVTTPDAFGSAWWRTTGSEAHLAAFIEAAGEPDAAADEAAVYERAGLDPIPPELREDRGELAAARDRALPRLLTVDDLRGTLHNHSTYSDGTHTLEEMAEAARALGLSYFGVCDHSQSLTIANGMSAERVRAQQRDVAALNARYEADGIGFRVFSGIESDILADGRLDYPDDVLETFDFVVASIHSGFNMTVDEATVRLIRAIEQPYTTILGHATGRLLLSREGYPVDHERVIAACAEHGVAIELNANPYRLDMDWRWIQEATRQGVMIAINPDAHATDQLEYVRWGVAVARKGWLTAEQCLNALPLDAFADWLERHRAARVA